MSSGDPGPRIKSLKDYNGRTRYSIYLLNQLNRLKVPVEDHVNHFLSYQDEDTVDAFYEYHSDYTLATWTDVEEFCEKRQPHTVKPFILRVTEVMEARRLPDELPNSYYNRLLSILAFGDMKEATTLVTLKLLNELPLQVKEHFSDRSSNIDLTLALSEWKKFLDRSKLREHFNDSYSRKIFRQPPPTPVKLPNPSVTPDTKPVVVNPLKTSRQNDSLLPTPPATPRRSKDEITCFNCREKGHYASACSKRDPVMHKNNAIVSDQVFSMSPRVFEMITINGEYVKVLIDSGTTVNILPKSLIEQLHVTVVPTKDSIQYGGGYVATPHGESVLSMFFIGSESTYTAKFLITDDEYPMITMESALALNINYQERLQSMLNDRERVVKTLNEIADQSPPVAHSLIENQRLWDESIPKPTERMKLPFTEIPKSSLAKPYDLKSIDRPKVAMEIARLLRLDQLLPIKSPIFSSPITSVISPNKTRICHDSRKLNQYMSNVDLQLPKLEEILGRIPNQEDLVFVQLDLRDAFKLIGIADEHQHYSTISTVWGNFYSPLLQFGYRCAPGMFHNYFASLLNTHEFPDCIQYMDDIIFYGNVSSLSDTLPKFFRKCSEKNFKLNLPKCKFFVNTITFLSFELSNNGIQVPKVKIDSLLGENKPDSITGMRSVIGKVNHISKFIPNYGQIMSSLHPKSESKFVWSERRTQDWNSLKDSLANTLTLRFPKSFDTLIRIEFQPLPDALQSVITFEEEGEMKLLDVNSRKMSPTERNYAIIEKEMTIVGEHLKNAQKIICAYDCEFVTPFKATEHFIKFGLEYSSKNVSNVSARIQRLIVPFISSGVSVTCKPKKVTQFCNSAVLEKARMPASLTLLDEWIPHDDILMFQGKDVLCLQLKSFLKGELKNVEKLPHYLRTRLSEIGFENGLLCVNSCPLVSQELAARLCLLIHEQDHKAETALYNTVINMVYTHGLSKIASSTVQNCQSCLKCRRNPIMRSIKWSKATFPRERGHFDCGYFNSKCFIVLIDSYSGYTFGRFLKDKSLEQLISFFDSVMVDQMPFKIIVSDNEPSLCSEGLSEYLKSTGTFYWGKGYERLNSPVYCPTANGLAEKIVGIVKTKFKHLTSKAIPFSKLMSYAFREINHQFRRSGETPAAKFYGMTAHLKLYKEPLGLPEPTDPTPIYFKKSRKEQEFMLGTLVAKLGQRILMIQDCFGDVHAVSKDFTHFQGKEVYTLKDTFMTAGELVPKIEDPDESDLDDFSDISVETAVPGEDVGYTSDPDEAALLSQFEVVAGHDDGLPHPKKDDVADDELSLKKILEKELESPETDTIAFIDGSSYSGGGYGILLYHRDEPNESFAAEVISERNVKCGAAKPTGGRMEIVALQKILEIAATRKFRRTIIFTDYKNAVGALKLNWIANWDEKNYVGVKHPYLWKSIYELSRQVKCAVFKIKAHVNIAPQETADQLAKGLSPKTIPDINNYFKKGSE